MFASKMAAVPLHQFVMIVGAW
eukprot:SAG11_NODE_38292_length_253_cov_0.584416_1_plen_21_part_10